MFDTVHFVLLSQLVTDISNEQTMWVDIYVGIGLGFLFFLLGIFMSRKVDKLIEKKVKLELRNKAHQCQRIIDQLEVIEQTEIGFKDTLINYQLGDPTNESLKFYTSLASHPITYSIKIMKDAMEQLQGKLDYIPLREEFLDYIDAFEILPKRILEYNQPQQDQEREGLIVFIDKQMRKIQYFIGKFTSEMGPTVTKKHEKDRSSAHEILDHRKYFNAPKL